MANYKQDEKLQAFYNSFLKDLLRKPPNSVCADCAERNPRFVSVKIGVFICNRCYAVHRSVGAHVTRTKCIGLDAWLPEEIALLRDVGNERAAAYWEANVPPERALPTSASPDHAVEKWIRDKYERRLFCDPRQPQPKAGNFEDLLAPPQKKPSANPLRANGHPLKSVAAPASGAGATGALSAPLQTSVPAAETGWADFESAFSARGAPVAASQLTMPAVTANASNGSAVPGLGSDPFVDLFTMQSPGSRGFGGP